MKVKKTKKPTSRKKPRRRIRKSVLIGFIAIIALIVYLIQRPYSRDNKALKQLGYDSETIKEIRQQNLLKEILAEGWYSGSLADAINDHTLNHNYIALYTVIADHSPEDEDFLLYSRLKDEGYEEEQILNLFSQLNRKEMIPLLVFDYQWDDQSYIDDVISHRSEGFALSADYRLYTKVTGRVREPDSIHMLVNRKFYLDESFEPSSLTHISEEYAVYETYLDKEASEAAVSMCQAGLNAGTAFFIADSYWDYNSLESQYNRYLSYMTENEADLQYAKAGFNEHQTGLAVNFAATYETAVEFRDSTAYQWLKDNCATFGFIERYPEGKDDITGRPSEPGHFRYVGIETAKAVRESGLTYDEFYGLYLQPWYDETLKPEDDILANIAYYDVKEDTSSTTEENRE